MTHTRKYTIEATDKFFLLSGVSFATLTDARKALRAANGGRLYGKYLPEGAAIEGWNLARNEGCDSAVIVRS